MNAALLGAFAGAAGTIALDCSTYADMAVRGRAPSSMTQSTAQKLAARLGWRALAASDPDEVTKNRQSAAGALLGYALGVGAGITYGLVRPALRERVPPVVAAIALGLAVMAATDGTASALGATDPREWTAADWAADLIPHLIYGVETAVAFEVLARAV